MGITQIRQCNVSNINHQTLTRMQKVEIEMENKYRREKDQTSNLETLLATQNRGATASMKMTMLYHQDHG